MTALLFGAAVVIIALLLERQVLTHSLDDVREDLSVSEILVEPDGAGELLITLRNTGGHTLPFLRATLHFPEAIRPCDPDHTQGDYVGMGTTVSYTTWLRPYEEVCFHLPVAIPARGRYVLEKLTVSGGDFLGLREKSRTAPAFQELVVPPPACAEPPVTAAVGSFLGDISVRRFLYEDPILVTGHREYTGREPLRDISWTQSARGQRLMVKQYDRTTEPRAAVLLHAEGPAEELERCYEIARTVCGILERQAVPYRLLINAKFDLLMNGLLESGPLQTEHREVPSGLGADHFHRVLEALGRGLNEPVQPCGVFLGQFLAEGDPCTCLLITSEEGLPDAGILADLGRNGAGPVHTLTPREVMAE